MSELERRLDRIEERLGILPEVVLTGAFEDYTTTEVRFAGDGESILGRFGTIPAKCYRTKAGRVTRIVIDICNRERDHGAVNMAGLLLEINGEAVYRFEERFSILPAARLVLVAYTGGPPLEYWQARVPGGGVVPPWAPAKLAKPQTFRYLGPFSYMWSLHGNGVGGGGVGPYRFDWRRCPEGYARAAEELQATAMKHRVAFYQHGKPIEDAGENYALMELYAIPQGFHADLNAVAEWWPDVWQANAEWPIDHQHRYRAYGAAEFLAPYDPFAADFLAEETHAIKLKWGVKDPVKSENHLHWPINQWLDEVTLHPGPNKGTGRGFAWCAYRIWNDDPDSELSGLLDEFILKSADSNGAVFANTDQSYMGWSRKHQGGPFEDNDPMWGNHERHLLIAAMRGRKRLRDLRRKMVEFGGNIGPKVLRVDGMMPPAGWGDPYPYFELAYGAVDSRYGSWQHVLDIGSGQPCDFTNIMNYCPQRFWDELVAG